MSNFQDIEIDIDLETMEGIALNKIEYKASLNVWEQYIEEMEQYDIDEALHVLGKCIMNDFVMEAAFEQIKASEKCAE